MNGDSNQILSIISAIRESWPSMADVSIRDNCMDFYSILKRIFPQARPWYKANHIITEIDGKFYDITGEVNNNGYHLSYDVYTKRKKPPRIIKQTSRFETQ
jgi:hypothetical protein